MRIDSPGRAARIVAAAAIAAFALVFALGAGAGQGQGATAAVVKSSQIAVVPGFAPPAYDGFTGVPPLPVGASKLAGYHFSQLAADQVTTASLQSYDTVLLYGIRWSDLSASAQQAINAFAATHKVLIWDADGTGPQSYSSFVHPFSTAASGENGHANDAVVSYPGGTDILASDKPSNPAYLDPNQLITDRNMINDMNVMPLRAPGWTPALVAADKSIPNGGWVLAWAYGNVGNRTGLTVYSGIDADAFSDQLKPNYAIKELALELAAPFRTTPASCGPTCAPPPLPPDGGTYASCGFSPHVPTHWVHGNVVIGMKTSAAAGISGKVLTSSGTVLASGTETTLGVLRMRLQTHQLGSNRVAPLHAVVYMGGKSACTRSFRLKVDNVPPRLTLLSTGRTATAHTVTVRVSEVASVGIHVTGMKSRRAVLVAARRVVTLHLPTSVRSATLVVRDRARNTVFRHLTWR